jgi:site-specific DNA-methyltransferase (adenine-specific)
VVSARRIERIASATLHIGDMREVLPKLAADGLRAHCCVTDPPYHLTNMCRNDTGLTATPYNRRNTKLGFMGKAWDGGDVAFRSETWRAVYDCLLPGGFMVAFASTRGYHRMVCAIEDAGFTIHPMVAWITGQGFPKAKRFEQPELEGWRYGLQALKPAIEPICMAQRPMEGTGSQNWARHGCGGLNVDACRVETTEDLNGGTYCGSRRGQTDGSAWQNADRTGGKGSGWRRGVGEYVQPSGRWPSNVVLSDDPEVEAAFAAFGISTSSGGGGLKTGLGVPERRGSGALYEGNVGFGDTGSASRFFYTAKADARDRAGSKHPTVKPTDLMRWLVRLVCPPGGLVLDPFAGSGSTGLAADQCGMRSVLVERDPTYAGDALRKIREDAPLFAEPAGPVPDLDAAYQRQTGDLFAEVEP